MRLVYDAELKDYVCFVSDPVWIVKEVEPQKGIFPFCSRSRTGKDGAMTPFRSLNGTYMLHYEIQDFS